MIYAVGILLSRALSVVMLPIYTRYLSPADYGVLELIGMTLEVIAIFAGAQIALGIFRYYHKAESECGAKRGGVDRAAGLGCQLRARGRHRAHGRRADLAAGLGTDCQRGLFALPRSDSCCRACSRCRSHTPRVRDRAMLFVTANAVKLVIGLT